MNRDDLMDGVKDVVTGMGGVTGAEVPGNAELPEAHDASDFPELPEDAELAARDDLDRKGTTLLALIRSRVPADQRIGIAYSGGVDSRFVAWSVRRAGCVPVLLHVSGAHVPVWEADGAKRFADRFGMRYLDARMPDDMLPRFAAAGRERCYVCKKEMMRLAGALAKDEGITLIADGSHAGDRQGWRPGARAVREAGIFSPLLEADFEKHEIRELARRWGMPDADQAARPCLMTRFPYGRIPSEEELKRVAAAESALEPLVRLGLTFRVRMLPEGAVVHVGKGAAPGILKEARVRTGLPVVEVETLSGWFDRPKE